MPKKMLIREVREMLERHWTELEIAHKLCVSPAEVHAIITQFFS